MLACQRTFWQRISLLERRVVGKKTRKRSIEHHDQHVTQQKTLNIAKQSIQGVAPYVAAAEDNQQLLFVGRS